MLYIIIAILAGSCIVISRIINFNLANKIGIFQGTFFNYAVGLFLSFLFLIISGEMLYLETNTMAAIPWWAFGGGFAGVVVVVLSTYLTPKLSAFYLTIFIFIGQLLVGGIIDYLWKGEFSMGKIIGGLLVASGLIYNLILDRNLETAGKTDG